MLNGTLSLAVISGYRTAEALSQIYSVTCGNTIAMKIAGHGSVEQKLEIRSRNLVSLVPPKMIFTPVQERCRQYGLMMQIPYGYLVEMDMVELWDQIP